MTQLPQLAPQQTASNNSDQVGTKHLPTAKVLLVLAAATAFGGTSKPDEPHRWWLRRNFLQPPPCMTVCQTVAAVHMPVSAKTAPLLPHAPTCQLNSSSQTVGAWCSVSSSCGCSQLLSMQASTASGSSECSHLNIYPSGNTRNVLEAHISGTDMQQGRHKSYASRSTNQALILDPTALAGACSV
jgi:hypothetical protein